MKKLIGLALVALGLLSTGVRADPISNANGLCVNQSCFGNVFTLAYDTLSSTHYLIHLFINTTGYNGTGGFITEVSIKPSDANTGFFLTAAPGGTSMWAVQSGGLNAFGCNGSGAGFICASDSTTAPVPFAGTYEWIFDVTVASASDWLLDTGDASIKARYGNTGQLTSENITLQQCPAPVCTPQQVPEPGILSLLGIALVGMGLPVLRRRKGKA